MRRWLRAAPDVMPALMERAGPAPARPPVFSLHAKALVVDSRIVHIGTFKFDPRSENLNPRWA